MNNFDLIDDYLTNKLSEGERSAFERAMEADPALNTDVARQHLIVEGIRKSRAAELKSMLNKVPVGGTGASIWSGWSTMRMAATVGTVAVIATGLYFYLKGSDSMIPNIPGAEIPIDSLMPNENSDQPVIENKGDETKDAVETTKPVEKKLMPKLDEAVAPKVEVVDPSEEMLSRETVSEASTGSTKSGISVSTIQVERDSKNKEYSFHYQFWEGKLFLFGPFDESLYEILEVHGDNRSMFLFFKDSFYFLDETKDDITPLSLIGDRALIRKLKVFRGGN